jgi:hypothetical protein
LAAKEVEMKKATVIAAAAGVWVSGIAAAAGLAYDVTKPLPVVEHAIAAATLPERNVVAEVARLQPERVVAGYAAGGTAQTRTIVLPTVEIVSKAAPPKVTRPRDISEMRCSAWRPLEQGAASVQICD